MVAIANKIEEMRLVEGYFLYREEEEYDPETMNNHACYFIKEINKRRPTPSIQILFKNQEIGVL